MKPMEPIDAVILAAGRSQRFGGGKLMADIGGKPLIYRSLLPIFRSRVRGQVIVLNLAERGILTYLDKEFDNAFDYQIRINPDSETGLMGSLKLGLSALPDDCAGMLICLADMPFLTVDIIHGLMAEFHHRPGVIMPLCEGIKQHPRLIPRRLFPEFFKLADNDSGQTAIKRSGERITTLEIGQTWNFLDIDRPADLETARGIWQQTSIARC